MSPSAHLPRASAVLLAGLLLGSAGAWLARHVLDAQTAAGASAQANPAASVALGAWAWRESATPAPLAGATIDAAIAGWLGLRAADGTSAALPARADALRALLARLPAEAFPRLLTPLAARVTSEDGDDRRLFGYAFDIWLERDPAAAARWAVTLADHPGIARDDLARQAAVAWAQLDADAAATWACAVPDETLARNLASAVLGRLADHDPARADALAGSRGDAFYEGVAHALLGALAKDDPATALRTYGPRLWKNGQGFWQLQGAIGAWIARDPAAALGWVVAQPRRSDEELARQLGNLWMQDGDRLAVMNALATVPGVPRRQDALGNMLFSWGTDQPEAAIAWLDALDDRGLRTELLERTSRITYTDEPQRSLPLSLAMPESAARTQRIADLLGQWSGRDSDAALAWMHEHDDPGVAAASASVYASILGNIARDEPATAVAEWEKLSDPATKAAALDRIASTWGQSDPGAALQWLSARHAEAGEGFLPDQQLVFAWARQDATAALRWAESLPARDQQINALRALAGTWREKADRASTADLYAQIADPKLRSDVLMSHLGEWTNKDPPAARAWIESHDALTPQQAALLLTGGRSSGP